MRQLQINKYSATLFTGQVTGRSGSFLLYMATLNVNHASTSLRGHYGHILALFIVNLSMFSHGTPDPSDQSLLSRALGTS